MIQYTPHAVKIQIYNEGLKAMWKISAACCWCFIYLFTLEIQILSAMEDCVAQFVKASYLVWLAEEEAWKK